MSSSKNGEGVHVLLIPYPAQGHILAILDFTHQLALRGITITVLITPKNLPILDPLLSAHPSIQTLLLHFLAGHALLPAGVEHVKDVGIWGNAPIISSLSKLRAPVVEWFGSHPNPPTAIIHDFFSGWAQDVVLILGWPMEADQYVNVRLLVDELGVSVRVSEGADTVPDTTELARIISESMNGHIVEKVRVKELSDKACDAVKVGGSSMKALDGLVVQLSQLNSPSNSG